ncbi:VOC family protein [Gemmobacter sp.]|uniref:bleomycin resistance protein n=1 Tax=Gemmobacter sp. TaxID=1898957 RepID=UPI002AFE9107|nr:VOC family protein [Gemmobacter sp.]
MANILVPELSVTDLAVSLRFYCDLLGFHLRYARPDEGFAYLDRDGAELMLDQLGLGRDFDPTLHGTARPYGRGVNLQIRCASVVPLLTALGAAGHTLHLPAEDRWYRRDHTETGNRQFIVADPDGYLLRFYQDLGERPL